MDSIVIALPNDNELAEWFGKKGTSNGVTFYNRRIGDVHATFLTPTNISEKFYALGEICTLADLVIISTRNIDAVFGESIVAAALLGKQTILTDDNDASKILKILNMNAEVLSKESLLEKIKEIAQKIDRTGSHTKIDIDRAFAVKGVGTVALGIITDGTVKKHSELYILDKKVNIRSLQVQDEDVESASKGARVGLALKDVDESEISKGYIMSDEKHRRVGSAFISMKLSPLAKDYNVEEHMVTAVKGFSVSRVKIAKKEGKYEASFERQMPVAVGDKILLLKDDSPRMLGCAEVIGSSA